MIESIHKEKIGKWGVIIFDGSCGACSALIGEKKAFFEKFGFTTAPLQEQWIKELTGLDETVLLEALHLYTSKGDILKAVDAFAFIAGKIWWLSPFALLLKIKLFKPLSAKIYNFIAQRRRKLTKICRLDSRALYK
jgi:predicted DCC family thiol-disulfide oxidoreductase YuxK